MKKKSLKLNIILNGIKTIMLIAYPLITFPYVSRVLKVENLGKVNFSLSIISYFIIFAGLGISIYAVRNGSGIRDDKKKFSEFANQIFTINLISTLASYIFLFVMVSLISSLQNYKLLLLIFSVMIMFTTLGVEWVYSVYEDFLYITIRSILFQIISLSMLFFLVKTENDYYLYALTIVIPSIGSNVLNFVNSKKYFKVKLTKNLNLKQHLKPILIIFATSIATTIYVNVDTTVLGLISGDYEVGLYSVSVKVYSLVKTLLGTAFVVSLPRLSAYLVLDRLEDFRKTANKIINVLIIVMLPMIIGLIVLSEEIILIISDESYLPAANSLRILSIAIFFGVFASFNTNIILLPMKKELTVLKATLIGAIFNLILNLIFIPIYQHNGAAVTTVVAEFIVVTIGFIKIRLDNRKNPLIDVKEFRKNITSSIIGCTFIIITYFVVGLFSTSMILITILTITFSIIAYTILLLATKNKIALEFVSLIKSKIFTKKKI